MPTQTRSATKTRGDTQRQSTIQNEQVTPVTLTTDQNTKSAPQTNTSGRKRRVTAGEEVESKKQKGTSCSKPPATGGKGQHVMGSSETEQAAQQEPQKARLSTPDVEFDYDRSQLRDPRRTPGRKARPRYDELDVPQDVKVHLESTRDIPKPEKPSGRLNSVQKDQLFDDTSRINPLHSFHDLYRCHDKGRGGSPTYDNPGFELDYTKVADWMKPQAYNKKSMIRNMDRVLEKGDNERTQIFQLFFEDTPKDPDGMLFEVKDYVIDYVSKDIGIPCHHVESEQVKMWRDQGFQPVKFKAWWKKPTAEEDKRAHRSESDSENACKDRLSQLQRFDFQPLIINTSSTIMSIRPNISESYSAILKRKPLIIQIPNWDLAQRWQKLNRPNASQGEPRGFQPSRALARIYPSDANTSRSQFSYPAKRFT
jgi:hypothetical protein